MHLKDWACRERHASRICGWVATKNMYTHIHMHICVYAPEGLSMQRAPWFLRLWLTCVPEGSIPLPWASEACHSPARHACMIKHTMVYTCIYIYIYIYMCLYVCMYAHTWIYAYVCLNRTAVASNFGQRICMRICVCACMYIYIYKSMHSYIFYITVMYA